MPKCVTFLNDLRLAPLLPPVLVLEHCLDLSLQFKQELLASLSHRDRHQGQRMREREMSPVTA